MALEYDRADTGLSSTPAAGSLHRCLKIGGFAGLLAAILMWTACAAPRQTSPRPESKHWRVGVLDGYSLFWVDPATGTRSGKTDLTRTWPPILWPRSGSSAKRMPTLPDVQVVASSLDGRILAALGGLMNRDDGPLVCFDIQTGGILETFDIRDQSAVAAFLGPSDERFIAAWEDEGRFRTALFDTMTGKRLAELPFIEYRVTGFRLSADQSKVLFDHVLDADNNAYAFLDLATRRFVGSLPLPADGSVSLLDMRQDTLLLLSRSDSKAWVSAWSYARQNADPVEIFALPRNGAAVETCFLAGRGDTVVRCGSNGSIHLYAADGRTLGDYQLGTRIRSFAAQPRGNLVAFAVDTDLIIFDLDSSQVISQFSKALGQATGRVPSLSWFMGP